MVNTADPLVNALRNISRTDSTSRIGIQAAAIIHRANRIRQVSNAQVAILKEQRQNTV